MIGASARLAGLAELLAHTRDEPVATLASEPLTALVDALSEATAILKGTSPGAGLSSLDETIGALVEAIATRDGGVDLIVAWIDRDHPPLSRTRLHRLANRVAWITRGNPDRLTGYHSTPGGRWSAWVVLERFRFVFDAHSIRETLSQIPVEDIEQDGLLAAFRAFHLVRMTTSSLEAESAIERALSHPDDNSQDSCASNHSAAAFDIVAHAVWLNFGLDNQGQFLESICERAIRAAGGDATPVILFRYAAALRLQGRYEEAILKVEVALTRLRGDSEFVRIFSEQLVRERELAVAGRFMNLQNDQAGRAIAQIEEKVADVDRKSIARIIEIVTLFTAVVAFALGGGSVATSQTGAPHDALIVLAGYGSVLVMFTIVVYCMIEVAIHQHSSYRRLITMALVVIAVCCVQFAALYAAAEFAFPNG